MDPLLAVVVIALGSMILTLGVLWLVLRTPPAPADVEMIRCRCCQAALIPVSEGPWPEEIDCPHCGADPITAWISAMVECRVCGYEHASVHPEIGRKCDLECPRCGCMACDPIAAD